MKMTVTAEPRRLGLARGIVGWHILPGNGRLAHGDDRLVCEGQTISVSPPISPCAWGLHASPRLLDACWFLETMLETSPGGAVVCRVVQWGLVQGHTNLRGELNKYVSSRRSVVWMRHLPEVQARDLNRQAWWLRSMWVLRNGTTAAWPQREPLPVDHDAVATAAYREATLVEMCCSSDPIPSVRAASL